MNTKFRNPVVSAPRHLHSWHAVSLLLLSLSCASEQPAVDDDAFDDGLGGGGSGGSATAGGAGTAGSLFGGASSAGASAGSAGASGAAGTLPAGGSGGSGGATGVGGDSGAGGELGSSSGAGNEMAGAAGEDGGAAGSADDGGAGGMTQVDDDSDGDDDDEAGGGGVGGQSDQGNPDADPVPSPGCGNGGRPSGGKVYKAGESWLVFPEAYDGDTPLPVLWGWHGCGSYNFGDANRTEYWDETRNSPFESEYVIAIPLAASGDCFNYDTDIVRTKQLYDELTENYCVDLNHMFGTGHSSGANFLHRMLQQSHSGDWEYLGLRGIAPVASGPVGDQTSQVPTMYIHSPGESVDPTGPAENFRVANGCGTESVPYPVDSCNSKHDRDPVNANCISYEGCDVTTVFCPHDDSNYDSTFHGIPCFFYQGAYDFFESL